MIKSKSKGPKLEVFSRPLSQEISSADTNTQQVCALAIAHAFFTTDDRARQVVSDGDPHLTRHGLSKSAAYDTIAEPPPPPFAQAEAHFELPRGEIDRFRIPQDHTGPTRASACSSLLSEWSSRPRGPTRPHRFALHGHLAPARPAHRCSIATTAVWRQRIRWGGVVTMRPPPPHTHTHPSDLIRGAV